MRVLVTGSRQMLDQHRVYRELDRLYAAWFLDHGDEGFTVIHGGAPGADTLANQWCWDRRQWDPAPAVEVHPAKWHVFGKMAGGIRNQEMVRSGADICIAFYQPGAANVGTKNCVTTARLAQIQVREVWE